MRRTILIPAAIAAFALSACGSDSSSKAETKKDSGSSSKAETEENSGSSTKVQIAELLDAEIQKQMSASDSGFENLPTETQNRFKAIVTEMSGCVAEAMADGEVTVDQVRDLIDAGSFNGRDEAEAVTKEILGESKFDAVENTATKCNAEAEKKFLEISSDPSGQ